eukprot:CAMPEP_0194393172 /NCGR_PEP_ID=MMETSP0174-20130528/123151_1 /TAXON_ID=216777 /ORGANISM="Proboscia alata, Strain PI-D3" /LENGTH=318 /DNA_ID=CAMNT_0039188829 /DNA_START=375 /DNA_END=1331 /DNA_ORIENTATION=+
MAPIERVKLLLQLYPSTSSTPIITPQCPPLTQQLSRHPRSQRQILGAVDTMRYIYQTEGLGSFWRGNGPNVLRQGSSSAVNFMLMDEYKRAVLPLLNLTLDRPSKVDQTLRIKRRKMMGSFLAGGLAGGTVTTLLYPLEFLRTRLAMDTGVNTTGVLQNRLYPGGMRDVLTSVVNSDGVRGLYQGYGIAVAGVVLYRALHLGGYDAVKTELSSRKPQDDHDAAATNLSWGERFLAAQIVSLVAGTICYPIDTVRRRLMMQAGVPHSERLYTNSREALTVIRKNDGMVGFYRGIGVNWIRSFGGAVLLVGYDACKELIH